MGQRIVRLGLSSQSLTESSSTCHVHAGPAVPQPLANADPCPRPNKTHPQSASALSHTGHHLRPPTQTFTHATSHHHLSEPVSTDADFLGLHLPACLSVMDNRPRRVLRLVEITTTITYTLEYVSSPTTAAARSATASASTISSLRRFASSTPIRAFIIPKGPPPQAPQTLTSQALTLLARALRFVIHFTDILFYLWTPVDQVTTLAAALLTFVLTAFGQFLNLFIGC
jgi:hypothetical protein